MTVRAAKRKYRVFGFVEMNDRFENPTQKFAVQTSLYSLPVCTCESESSAKRIAAALNYKEGRTKVKP